MGNKYDWNHVSYRRKKANQSLRQDVNGVLHGYGCKMCNGVKIDHKCFAVSFENAGGWLTERRHIKTAIKLSWTELEWFGKKLIDVSTGRSVADFAEIIGLRKITFKREANHWGSYVRLDCVEKNRVGKIIVPQGKTNNGWLELGDLILSEIVRREDSKLQKKAPRVGSAVDLRTWEVKTAENSLTWMCGSEEDMISELRRIICVEKETNLHVWWSSEIWKGQRGLRVVPVNISKWEEWPPITVPSGSEKKIASNKASTNDGTYGVDLAKGEKAKQHEKPSDLTNRRKEEGHKAAGSDIGSVDLAGMKGDNCDLSVSNEKNEDTCVLVGSDIGSMADRWVASEPIPDTWRSNERINDKCSSVESSMGNSGFSPTDSSTCVFSEEPNLTKTMADNCGSGISNETDKGTRAAGGYEDGSMADKWVSSEPIPNTWRKIDQLNESYSTDEVKGCSTGISTTFPITRAVSEAPTLTKYDVVFKAQARDRSGSDRAGDGLGLKKKIGQAV